MNYIKNLDIDEIRSEFLVKSDQKRLWNVQIALIKEVQRICEKYNLRFFAAFGTLLGAVRHQGFIPWDGDVDLCMFRSDYEKFKEVARNEIRYPYYFDIWYNNVELEDDPQEHFPYLPFIKLRDERTTKIENNFQFYRYIAIDIFPLDTYPPFNDETREKKFRMLYELTFAACWTKRLDKFLQNSSEQQFFLDRKFLKNFSKLPMKDRGMILDKKFAEFDFPSKYVSTMWLLSTTRMPTYERAWFDETVYLPFEEVSLPCPKEFEKVLTAYYGNNWNEPKIYGAYTQNFSVDIPYKIFSSAKNYRNHKKNLDELRNGQIIRTRQKKIWKVQLNLIQQLKKLGLKFFAIDQTLFDAINLKGFNLDNEQIQFGMPQNDFERLQTIEIKFPYRFANGRFSNDLTTMADRPTEKDIPQGIFIEIIPVDYDPEIIQMPFENISIPVPKNYFELLENFEPSTRKFIGDISADIPWREYMEKIRWIIYYATNEFTRLEK